MRRALLSLVGVLCIVAGVVTLGLPRFHTIKRRPSQSLSRGLGRQLELLERSLGKPSRPAKSGSSPTAQLEFIGTGQSNSGIRETAPGASPSTDTATSTTTTIATTITSSTTLRAFPTTTTNIFVWRNGGLGNQFFEVAAGLAAAWEASAQSQAYVSFSAASGGGGEIHNPVFANTVFSGLPVFTSPNPEPPGNHPTFRVFQGEKDLAFRPILEAVPASTRQRFNVSVTAHGYFQDPRYFTSSDSALRERVISKLSNHWLGTREGNLATTTYWLQQSDPQQLQTAVKVAGANPRLSAQRQLLNLIVNYLRRDAISGAVVAIHVRRGDYVSKAAFHGLLPMEYYYRALKMLEYQLQTRRTKTQDHRGGPGSFIGKLVIFTDDPAFVKRQKWPYLFEVFSRDDVIDRAVRHESRSAALAGDRAKAKVKMAILLSRVRGHVGVGLDDSFDLFLMSLLDHFVIANSTFSWWAAFLSPNRKSGGRGRLVIMPDRWYGPDAVRVLGAQATHSCSAGLCVLDDPSWIVVSCGTTQQSTGENAAAEEDYASTKYDDGITTVAPQQ